MASDAATAGRTGTATWHAFHDLPGARHFTATDLASWHDAERRYRSLVQRCHPDRQGTGSKAPVEAEFVELTTAFNQLRKDYQATGGLPIPRAAVHVDHSGTTCSTGLGPRARRRGTNSRAHGGWRQLWRRSRYAIAALAVILSLMVLITVLERRMQDSIRERGEFIEQHERY